MNKLSGSKILITGGTGSFGKAFVKELLTNNYDLERLVIFSRDELKQWQMSMEFPEKIYPQIRYFLGDIRDKERLKRALDGINIVVHAAALKQVPAAEYNPMEFIKTNVMGSENIIQACIDSSVEKVIALSTDKAAAPINLYGATKLCSDKLFIAANNFIGNRNLAFSVVRYANVMGSRGSVIPLFLKQAQEKVLHLTDPEMTRFNISLNEGVKMIIWSILNSFGGEIFVPRIPSYRLSDIAEAIGPNCEHKITGLRPGEKLHEEMITSSDSYTTYDLGKYFCILSAGKSIKGNYQDCIEKPTLVKNGFSYNSFQNSTFLSVEEIRNLIRLNVNREFNPT